MEEVLQFLCGIRPLSAECLAYLRRVVKEREVKKDDVILKIGDVNDKLYFIGAGALHCFYYVKAKPVSDWFFWKGEIVVSIGSFYDQVPSEDCIVALEASALFYITREQYDYLNATFLEFNYVARVLLEKYLKIFNGHARFIRKHPAAERYQLVLLKKPELVHRVSVAALATWLGIEPNSLSRIREELNKKNSIEKGTKKGRNGLKKGHNRGLK
ncbi:MAG TPA: Crp/Fnr family transcriptional regulator [Puia sp.]|nr:Crp/Fnr family transcriptional regulator [Puia sp.]